MKLIDKNKLLEGLKKLKQNLSASPIVVIEDVESLVESLEVKDVNLEKEIEEEVHKHFHDYYGIVNSDTGYFAKVYDLITSRTFAVASPIASIKWHINHLIKTNRKKKNYDHDNTNFTSPAASPSRGF